MTPRQTATFRRIYHATFGELCRQFDLPNTSDQRHTVNYWILGYDTSSSQWSAKEYSIVIDCLKDWIRGDIKPHKLSKQEQDRLGHDARQKQLIHVIERIAPDAYTQAVANDRHGQRPWRNLSAFQLTRLRFTLEARAASARRKGKTL